MTCQLKTWLTERYVSAILMLENSEQANTNLKKG